MILQRDLNRSTFVVWEMWRHHNMRWKWPPFASRQDWTRRAIFWKVLASTFANNKHSLLQIIPIPFPTILCELTHYTNTHEQQTYCVGTLSQMTERSAERRVRQETGWLAGGPLFRVPTIRRTTDTFLFISHTTNVLLFKSRCNIVICVRIIKELPGLVSSGTPCIILTLMHLLVLLHELFIKCTDMNNISIQILQTHTRLTMDRYWRRLMASRNEATVVGWRDIRSKEKIFCFINVWLLPNVRLPKFN